jgi:hypothetical protein
VRVATAVLAAVLALILAGCGDDEESTTTEATTTEIRGFQEQKIEQVGNDWALLFAEDNVAACEYIFGQPLCERYWGDPGGEPPEVSRPSAFQESFADATVERVEVKRNRAGVEFSNGEVVEFIQETQKPPNAPQGTFGDWFVLDVGGNAGEKYFESAE